MNIFRDRCGWVLLFFAIAFAGCGAGTPQAAKSAAPAKTDVIKTVPPALARAAVAPAKPTAEAKPVKKLNLNPFQMPEVPEEFLPPKEEPKLAETASSVKQTERPRLRLLGFSNVDGFKALVELKGDVQAVAAGDVIEGVQVVSVEPPNVTFQFASSRWATKLFEQPWHNEQTGVALSSRSTPRANTGASITRAPAAASTRRSAGPNMFGAGAGAGVPQIGVSSGSAIPGMPSSNSAGGIPGLGSIPGMPGAPGGGMPGLPGSTGIPAMPGAGGLPGSVPTGGSISPGGYALPGGPPN